ncbi:MOB kinase activator 3B-like [Anneissia japonica]|uniref:MOB kinase activator 3B-like n=1 Tax=Anneissia japonica TaxID=1529436 RepID=UPI00142552B4|nr:MOB kinase activator 3B-like [Anneissia japonica]
MDFGKFFSKEKTFRPKKKFQQGTMRYELHKKAEASLNSGLDLKSCVSLPAEEDFNDWMAVHVVDFFNRINLIYGTICDYCTDESCPIMSGGPKYEYMWCDGNKYKKPTKLPANKYIANLMDWIETIINDESVFPVSQGKQAPKSFCDSANSINLTIGLLQWFYRMYNNVYVCSLQEAHINTCYKHYYYFIVEFKLVDRKELEPLKDLTERICH